MIHENIRYIFTAVKRKPVGIKCQGEPEIGSNDYAVMLHIFRITVSVNL